ncbi:MAG: dipeptide epimerase [Proteobacteria bacterium]|nr:dipeptide epimerase [Pseudomonadota bacterium]
MKIKRVAHWTEDLELSRPYTIAYETISAVENHFVKIEAENGAFGMGASSPSPEVTGETSDDCSNALEKNLEPLLLGQDVRYLRSLNRKIQIAMASTPAARAAVDIALHDLMAQYLKLPLVEMLGRVHRSLPTSITIGIQSTEESLAETEEYLARGFRILKVKIGSSLEEDLERLCKLRDKVGREVKIRVDANQGYSLSRFKEFVKKTESLNIEFIEQPLKAADIEGMRGLPKSARAKTAADESLLDLKDALNLTRLPQPFGIYNIKLMKCGGITTAMQMADVAEASGIDLMWGCNDESIVSITAALHAALASPATRYLDLDGSLDLARDLVKGGFVLENGELGLTDRPGLGVEPI